MQENGKNIVGEEISRSMTEVTRRKDEGNTLINRIVKLIEQEQKTLFYADDEYKKKLMRVVSDKMRT